jgi:pyruvate dehydrogenase (quinone)
MIVINKYAAEDALFAADDGTALVWTLRHIETSGNRRTFCSFAARHDGERDR